MNDKVRAGDLQNMKAMERVVRKNIESGMAYTENTRKMILELKVMFDALQANVMNMKAQQDQVRAQLTNLQQQFYARGTTSYADGDKE
jgi:hypothetical protein